MKPYDPVLAELSLHKQVFSIKSIGAVFILNKRSISALIVNYGSFCQFYAGQGQLACRKKHLCVGVRRKYLLSISAKHVHHNYRSQHNYDSNNDRKLDKREALFVL